MVNRLRAGRIESLTILLIWLPTARAVDLVFPGETWEVATPESRGVDSQRLEAAVALLPDPSRTLVVRHGRVIWEGSRVNDPTSIASITKAFASTALGLLVDEGVLTLDTAVETYNPALSEAYSDVTFRHLTTYTGNINGSPLNPGAPYFEPSGSRFYYNTVGSNLGLSHGIQVASGQSLGEFVTERIAEPIGMDTANFEFTQTFLTTADREVVRLDRAGFGLNTTANNVARFGLLFMNEGEWDGRRIVSADWVEQATTVQVPGETPVHEGADFTGVYGLGGWFQLTENSFDSFGAGNSRLFVDPGAGLIVASLRNQSGESTHSASFAMVDALYDALLPANGGDYTGDGLVDALDYEAWRATYGEAVDPYTGADSNGDGLVDAADYTAWRDATATAAIPTPEPATGWLALVACVVAQRRRPALSGALALE